MLARVGVSISLVSLSRMVLRRGKLERRNMVLSRCRKLLHRGLQLALVGRYAHRVGNRGIRVQMHGLGNVRAKVRHIVHAGSKHVLGRGRRHGVARMNIDFHPGESIRGKELEILAVKHAALQCKRRKLLRKSAWHLTTSFLGRGFRWLRRHMRLGRQSKPSITWSRWCRGGCALLNGREGGRSARRGRPFHGE